MMIKDKRNNNPEACFVLNLLKISSEYVTADFKSSHRISITFVFYKYVTKYLASALKLAFVDDI